MSVSRSMEIRVEFLFDSSKNVLQEYELSRLNMAANLKKDLRSTVEGIIDSLVEARFARWLMENKEELCRTVGSVHVPQEVFDFGSDADSERKTKAGAAHSFKADAAD